MIRTWQDNAEEFAALTKQGKDLRLAVLVACSVEVWIGRPTNKVKASTAKTSAQAFAKVAGTSDKRLLRHLAAWNNLATRGLVIHSRFLQPGNVNDVECSDDAVAAFAALNLSSRAKLQYATLSAALREAAEPTPRPIMRLAYDSASALEAARVALAPMLRQASFAVEAIGKLTPHERMELADDLQRLKAIFTALADEVATVDMSLLG